MPKRRIKGSASKTQAVRTKLAVLKRKGLFAGNPKTAGATKKNKALTKKYSQVITGKADVWKLSPKMARKYKKARLAGFKVVEGDRIIVTAKEGYARSQVIKGDPIFHGMIAHVKPLENGEIETVQLPEKFRDIRDLVEGVQENPEWNALKETKERFTFRINEHPALQGTGFATLQQMAEYLSNYNSVKAENSRTRRGFMEVFEIVRIKRGHNLRDEYETEFFGTDRTGRSKRKRAARSRFTRR